ncbi:MAG: VanZ family protein [Parafilimonas sp.]
MNPKLISFIPAFIWFLITTILLVIPGSDLPKDAFLEAIYFDKWVHIGLFGTLVFLMCLPLVKRNNPLKAFLVITFSGIAYGIFMEFVQKFWTTDRAFDITDMLADAVGCFLAWIFIKRLYTLKKKPL